MPVNYIELGGESRPVKFGFNALMEWGKLTNRTVADIETISPSKLTLEDLLLLFWCGLKNGARIEKKEFTASVEDLGDWFDEDPQAMIELTKEYMQSKSPDASALPAKKKGGKPNR